MRPVLVALLVLGLGPGLAGCQQSAEQQREEYCAAVAEEGSELTRIADEAGPAGFLQALPILEGLAARAPSDVRDEWQTFLDALHGLRDALEESGVDPEAMGEEGLPEGLSRAERRRVRAQASVLASGDVVAATQGIEQHALDVCRTPIL